MTEPERTPTPTPLESALAITDATTNGIITLVQYSTYATRIEALHHNSAQKQEVETISLDVTKDGTRYVGLTSHFGYSYPKSVCHFYKMDPIDGNYGHPWNTPVGTGLFSDDYPFMEPMARRFGGAVAAAPIVVDVNHPGLEMYINPFDLPKTKVSVNGISALSFGQFTGAGTSVSSPAFGSSGVVKFLEILFSLVPVSRVIGRYIYVTENVLGQRYRLATDPALAHISGRMALDDYVRYPHVPEALKIVSRNKWFRAEIDRTMPDLHFGTHDNADTFRVDGEKVGEVCYTGGDTLMSEFQWNFVREIDQMRINMAALLELHASCSVQRADLGDLTDRLYFRRFDIDQNDIRFMRFSYKTFPYTDQIYDAYRFAFYYSSGFRQQSLDVLTRLATSILSTTEVKLTTELQSVLTGSDEIVASGMSDIGLLLSGFTAMTKTLSIERMAACLVTEMYPVWFDFMPAQMVFGSDDPPKFLTSLLSMYIAFCLQPVTFDHQPHIKASYIYAFCQTFFKDEVSYFISTRGYGIYDNGTPDMRPANRQFRRKDSPYAEFTLLGAIPANEPGQNQAKWRLFSQVVAFLNRDVQTYPVVRQATPYSRAREMIIPGQPYGPTSQVHDTYPITARLNGVFVLFDTYVQIYKRSGRISSRTDIGMVIWRPVVSAFILSFSEWYHRVYCFAAYDISLLAGLMCLEDNARDYGADWRAFPAIREDMDRLNALGIHDAPHAHAVQVSMSHDTRYDPILPSEAGHVLSLWVAPYSTYACGRRNKGEPVVDWDEVKNFYLGMDPRETIKIYSAVLTTGHAIAETIMLVSGMSTGSLIVNPVVRQFTRDLFRRRLFTSEMYVMLTRFFGQNTNDAEARRSSGNLLDLIPSDPRIYCPQLGTSTEWLMDFNNPINVLDPIRPTITENFNLLVNAIFGADGILPVRAGIVASEIPHRHLNYDTVHGISNVRIIVSERVVAQRNYIRTQAMRQFFCSVEYTDMNGDIIVYDNDIAFSSIRMLFDLLSQRLPIQFTYITAVVRNKVAYSDVVFDVIRRGVQEQILTVYYSEERYVQGMSIKQPDSIGDLIYTESQLFERMMRSDRHIGCEIIETVNTTSVRGGYDIPHITKLLLPVEGSLPQVFTTDVLDASHRKSGIACDFNTFFHPTFLGPNERVQYMGPDGRHHPACPTYPMSLRTPIRVWNKSPVLSAELVVCESAV